MLAAVNVLVVAFAVLAGVAGSVQVAVMSKLGDRVGVFGALAWATTLAAFLAVAVMLVARQGFGEFAAAARQPVWLWSGALMSVIIVLAITVAGSRIGVIATVSVLLAGQFAAGAAIDRWGLLGAERVGVGWWKIVGDPAAGDRRRADAQALSSEYRREPRRLSPQVKSGRP